MVSKKYHQDLEIITLAFERSLNQQQAQLQLKKTIQKYQVPFPVLIAGSTAEDKPSDKIKGIKNFISFPTTIFLSKKHEIIKVHAGFSGPSTGEYYENLKREFFQIVEEITK